MAKISKILEIKDTTTTPSSTNSHMLLKKIETDLFHAQGQTYIVVADYYFLYPEVYSLSKLDCSQIVEVMKDALSIHGIATELVSDDGSHINPKSLKISQRNENLFINDLFINKMCSFLIFSKRDWGQFPCHTLCMIF